MSHPDRDNLTRRDAVLKGIAGVVALGGVGGLLSACASSGSASASLPSVRWPTVDPRSPSGTPARPSTPSRPAPRVETPRPQPGYGAPSSDIIPRTAWASAGVIPARMNRMLPVRRITLHHDGLNPVALRSRGDVAARIDQIRLSHNNRGWGDIGYHYVVDPLGNVWEGRPLSWQGAHVGGQNEGNIGVLVLGNFEEQRPTGAQIDGVDRFVSALMLQHRIPVGRVHTHRELAKTECPGRNLQPLLNVARAPGGALHLA